MIDLGRFGGGKGLCVRAVPGFHKRIPDKNGSAAARGYLATRL
jgi:hypothetical protein